MEAGLPTETIKIMASRAREISLHAFVRVGLPIGTKAKPGGGLESFVTCYRSQKSKSE